MFISNLLHFIFVAVTHKKKPISATIDPRVLRRLETYCETNHTNRSRLIEHLIKEFLDGELNE